MLKKVITIFYSITDQFCLPQFIKDISENTFDHGCMISESDSIERTRSCRELFRIHKLCSSISYPSRANRPLLSDMTGFLRIRHTVRLANEKSHLDVIRNSDPVITLVRSLIAFPLNARRNILLDPESQSNAARRATTVAEKNKIEAGRPDERRYRTFIAIEWARTVSVQRFLVFPVVRSKSTPPSRIVDDRMAGSKERSKAEKERQEKRRRTKKKRGEKGESREGGDRPSIILQSGQDGRDSKLPVSRHGHNLQFLTIRLDQPPYKGTYYVATLRWDSHGRSDTR